MVYAVMYGAGKEKLSEVLHISQSEARDVVSSFMSKAAYHDIYVYVYSFIIILQHIISLLFSNLVKFRIILKKQNC